MPFVHGRLAYFKLGTNDLSAWMDDITFDHTADLHETTTYGKSYKTRIGGLKDGSFSIGGIFDAAAGGPEAVIRPLVGGAATAFEYGPEGSTTAKTKYTGTVIVESYQQSVPVGDVVRWTATLQNTDTITVGTFI